MIRPPIWLAADEPKCAGNGCMYPKSCARRDISSAGRPMVDYGAIGYCVSPIWRFRIDPATAVKPVDPPQVKEWIGS